MSVSFERISKICCPGRINREYQLPAGTRNLRVPGYPVPDDAIAGRLRILTGFELEVYPSKGWDPSEYTRRVPG